MRILKENNNTNSDNIDELIIAFQNASEQSKICIILNFLLLLF